MKTLLTFFLILAAGATSVQAQDKPAGGKKTPEENFKKLDANSDGSLTMAEFKAGPKAPKDATKAEQKFKKRDQNGDGSVTLEEWKATVPGKG